MNIPMRLPEFKTEHEELDFVFAAVCQYAAAAQFPPRLRGTHLVSDESQIVFFDNDAAAVANILEDKPVMPAGQRTYILYYVVDETVMSEVLAPICEENGIGMSVLTLG